MRERRFLITFFLSNIAYEISNHTKEGQMAVSHTFSFDRMILSIYLDELETQQFFLLLVGFEAVTSYMRDGQLDQTSTEVCKNLTAFSIILGTCIFDSD